MEPMFIGHSGESLAAATALLEKYKEGEIERDSLPPFTIEWNDKSKADFIGFLKLAEETRRHVEVIFPDLTVDHITDVIFGYRSVRPSIEFPESYTRCRNDGLIIGKQWPEKIEDYDKRRFVSLISDETQGFVEDLRNAILAMKKGKTTKGKTSVDPPWDTVGKVTRIKRNKETKRREFATKRDEDPLLSDILELYDASDASDQSQKHARELLDNSGDRYKWGGRSVNLLVTGDSGTGKSLVARLAHDVLYGKDRKKRPFVSVNCGALDGSSLVFRLLGGLPGSFTDITTAQVGLLARAAYGTVFLDEFGDLPNNCQPFFLTYLQDLEITPAGGDVKPFYSYCYVVAATNRDLGASIRATEFRNDLTQRFSRRVKIPSLRERSRSKREIIALIDMAAQHPDENPMDTFREERCRWVRSISHEALQRLLEHDYVDGNVRELESIVHAAIEKAIRNDSDVVELEHLPEFGPSNFRPDAERNMVGVPDLPNLDSQVSVDDFRDLDRIAQRSDRPILKSESEYGVIVDNVLYRASSKPGPED